MIFLFFAVQVPDWQTYTIYGDLFLQLLDRQRYERVDGRYILQGQSLAHRMRIGKSFFRTETKTPT